MRLGARRLDPGADPGAAEEAAGGARPLLPLHLARHGGGGAGQPPRRRHVSRPDRRDRPDQGGAGQPAAPLYARSCWPPCRSPTPPAAASRAGGWKAKCRARSGRCDYRADASSTTAISAAGIWWRRRRRLISPPSRHRGEAVGAGRCRDCHASQSASRARPPRSCPSRHLRARSSSSVDAGGVVTYTMNFSARITSK